MGTVTNGTAVSPTQHTITILDNDTPPEVNFAGSTISKLENAGSFQVLLNLDKTALQDISVPLIISGTASDPADYTLSDSSVTIPAGTLSGSFQVNLQDDSTFENDETLLIDLGNPSNAVLGTNTSYTVTIEDDELPLCEVGTHMLTVGSSSISWSITNQGEMLILTGGSVAWPDSGGNKPRLTSIAFGGSTIWSGKQKPPSLPYSTWETFAELGTTSMDISFDEGLGTGTYQLQASFLNAADGTTCSLIENYEGH